MITIENCNLRRDAKDFMALALSDAAGTVECKIVKLTLDRHVSVELHYLVFILATGWVRRVINRSVVVRIPRYRGEEEKFGLGHHMESLLTLFYQGGLTDRLNVLDSLTPLIMRTLMTSRVGGCHPREYGIYVIMRGA